MNCAARAAYEATEEIAVEHKKRKKENKYKHYDFVHDEFIDLNVKYTDDTPQKIKIKRALKWFLKNALITVFSLTVVIVGYLVLFMIIS